MTATLSQVELSEPAAAGCQVSGGARPAPAFFGLAVLLFVAAGVLRRRAARR
jgi:MYXO-CTERM domain-containing protein